MVNSGNQLVSASHGFSRLHQDIYAYIYIYIYIYVYVYIYIYTLCFAIYTCYYMYLSNYLSTYCIICACFLYPTPKDVDVVLYDCGHLQLLYP